MHIPTIDELKKALHLGERIEALQHELASIFGKAGTTVLEFASTGMKAAAKGIESMGTRKKRRKLSAASKKAIAEGQKKRWAKVRDEKKGTPAAAARTKVKPAKKRKVMSEESRARIAEAQKARWAKVKAEKKA